LSVVISQVNADVGATVAFNDNGFLKLQSPTVGGSSYLKVMSDPLSGAGNVLKNLGLFAETEAFAGDFVSAQPVDPDRQVATPNQMTMAEGESFEAKVFNRAIAQLALNNDRNEGLLSKKRLAARSTIDIGSYSVPGAVNGYQMSGGNLVYVGKASTPSRTALMKLFALLDSEGRELTKEMYPAVYTGYSGSFNIQKVISGHDQGRLVVVSSAFNAGDSFEKGNYYLACNTFTGDATALNGKLLKIIEVRSGLGASSEAVVDNVDSATGLEVVVAPQSRSFTIFTRQQARVVVDGVFENLAAAVAGTPRLENVQVTKRSALVPTRIELGNRIVVYGHNFLGSPAVQAGDLITWSGSTVGTPFNNNGSYRVERVVDKQTLQVVASDWGAAFLNPDFTSGVAGTFNVTSDGAFVLDPFLRFPNDSTNPAPTAGQAMSIAYLKGTTFRQATDDDPAMLGGDLSFSQEADDSLTQAVLKIWGSGVTTLDEILYGDARVNLKSIEDRLDTEHYRYDEADKTGSGATDTRSWGRHKDINPDTINMVYWDNASYSNARTTLRGKGVVNAGDDYEDLALMVSNTLTDGALKVTARGHLSNRGFPSVHTWVDIFADGNVDSSGLGSASNNGDRYLQRLGHQWAGTGVGSSVNSLITQELSTNITTTTTGTFTEVTGQRVVMDIGAAAKPAVTNYRWHHLKGTLTGDGTGSIGTVYGIHVDYSLTAPLVITGDHYGLKITDITRASGTNYAIYTGLGWVRLGDNAGINTAPTSDVGLGVSLSWDDVFVCGINNSVTYTGVDVCDDVVGYISNRSMTGGTVSFSEGMIINDIDVVDGTCEENYGIWIGGITAGTVANYAVYSTNGRAYYNLSPNEEVGDLIAATLDVVMQSSNDADYSAGSFVLDGVRSTAGYTGASTFGPVEQLNCFKADTRGVVNGSVTESAGMRIRDISTASGGACSINYGLYIENQTGGTNNYAIVTQLGKISFNDQVITYVQDSHNSLTQGIGFESTAVENGASPTSGSVGFHFAYSMSMPSPASSFTADAFRITTTNNGRNTGTHSNIRLTDSYTVVSGTHVGLYVDTMTSGSAGNNWGIWVNGNPSYFGGSLNVGSGATVNYAGKLVQLKHTWSSALAQDITGLDVNLTSSLADAGYERVGESILFSLTHTSGNVPAVYGIKNWVLVDGSGGSTSVACGALVGANTNAGTISVAKGLEAFCTQYGGTITTAYGLYTRVNHHGGGTITTAYGIYVEPMPVVGVTTTYALYTAQGKVKFGGAVGGVVVGEGLTDQGSGTINVQNNIFKAGSSYLNPDYVFELAFTGKIEKYKDNEGASSYQRMSLSSIKEYAQKHWRLPGIEHEKPCGIFTRADIALEKIEDLYLHLFEKDEEIRRLQGRVERLEAAAQ
jgi:hypothetical protein